MSDRTIVMYGLPPVGDPDPFEPYKPSVDPNPFFPNPNIDMTTLTRLYNLEQEVNRLKIELEELRKSQTTFDAKLSAAPEVVANAVVLAFDKTKLSVKRGKKARKPK